MKCEYCGRTLLPGETQCPGCGAAVENLETHAENAAGSNDGKIELKVNGVNISIDGLGQKAQQQSSGSSQQVNDRQNAANGGYTFNTNAAGSQNMNANVPPTPGYTGNNPQMMQGFVEYAGFWRRVAATMIDGLLMTLVSMTGIGVLLSFIYEPLCEAYWDGATIGKKIMGIKVVNKNFEKIDLGQAFGRYFAKFVCVLTFYIGFIMVAFSSQKRGLHDRMAGTYVIHKR